MIVFDPITQSPRDVDMTRCLCYGIRNHAVIESDGGKSFLYDVFTGKSATWESFKDDDLRTRLQVKRDAYHLHERLLTFAPSASITESRDTLSTSPYYVRLVQEHGRQVANDAIGFMQNAGRPVWMIEQCIRGYFESE